MIRDFFEIEKRNFYESLLYFFQSARREFFHLSRLTVLSFFPSLIFSFCYILNMPYFLYLRFFSDSYIYLLPQFFSPHRILFHCLLPRPPLLPPPPPPLHPVFHAPFSCFSLLFTLSDPRHRSFLPSFSSLSLFTPILFRFPFAYSTSLQRRTYPLSLHLV